MSFEHLLSPSTSQMETDDGGAGIRARRPPAATELRRFEPVISLFDYQVDVERFFLSTNRVQGVLSLPTGSGKTATLASGLIGRHGRLGLWLAPQRELLNQARATFERLWWGGRGPDLLDLIVYNEGALPLEFVRPTILFMTPQMALNRPVDQLKFDWFCVFDEAHHLGAQEYNRIWQEVTAGAECVIGLSATPEHQDEEGFERLRKSFDSRLLAPQCLGEKPAHQLIESGVLARPAHHPFIEGDSFESVNLNIGQFVKQGRRWKAVLDAIKTSTEKSIVFTANRSHGEALTKELRFQGVSAEYLDGETTLGRRHAIFERFHNGDTRVLVNVELLVEGVDCPDASCVFLTYPVRQIGRLKQMIGRALRGPLVGGSLTANVYMFGGSQELLENAITATEFDISGWKVDWIPRYDT